MHAEWTQSVVRSQQIARFGRTRNYTVCSRSDLSQLYRIFRGLMADFVCINGFHVKLAVLDRFGDVSGGYAAAAFQIRDRPGKLEDPVIRTHAEPKSFKRGVENPACFLVQRRITAKSAAVKLAVPTERSAMVSPQLDLPSCVDLFPHFFR